MPNHGLDAESIAPDPWTSPLRDLRLSIHGTALETILAEFERELDAAGIHRLRPRFYLSTEWGVCEGTIAVAIPFYLATPELTALQADRVGHVEGAGKTTILRYLRHEMGHVVNYAYRLFDTSEWVELFGSMDEPYHEEFRLEPFSRRFVRHLPGWYAQKHPDEDWSETFAVWMTPHLDWRAEYAEWPAALAKLQYCDRTMAALGDRDPIITADELNEDVAELSLSAEQFYEAQGFDPATIPAGFDGALRSVFEDLAEVDPRTDQQRRGAVSDLIHRLERDLLADIYRWTGHFPERTRPLLRHLAERADGMALDYPLDRELSAAVALTTLVTSLAVNHVQHGAYFR